MKRHGNYTLPTPDELLLDAESGTSTEYLRKVLRQLTKKHSNDKRHKEKKKKMRIIH